MLVLSRKPGQSIHIDDEIKITVLKTKGNAIRIGIEAPKEMRVLRAELDEWSVLAVDCLESARNETGDNLRIA